MHVPDDLLYTKEHEWVRIEGNNATVGITDHAQGALGDITFVDLPKVGSACEQFKQYATVESVKAASDVYAPVSGEVSRINQDLASHPELINKSPYDKGYFAVIAITGGAASQGLMKADEYKKYLESLT